MIVQMVFRSFLVGAIGGWFAGPIFMLVMQRSVTRGVLSGIASALGTSLVEGTFFSLALAGLLHISFYDGWMVHTLEFFGGVFLIGMGVRILQVKNTTQQIPIVGSGSTLWMGVSAAIVTLSNPIAILFYAGVAAKLFSEYIVQILPLSVIVYSGIAVAIGAFSTLSLVSVLASKIGNFFSDSFQMLITRLMGLAFLGIGAYLLFNLTMYGIKLLA
ncbi:LysE family transporter [Candidatus Babeliales bacterium]|nr:LysE family transporter [Candidatus Babeliales bacterium]